MAAANPKGNGGPAEEPSEENKYSGKLVQKIRIGLVKTGMCRLGDA